MGSNSPSAALWTGGRFEPKAALDRHNTFRHCSTLLLGDSRQLARGTSRTDERTKPTLASPAPMAALPLAGLQEKGNIAGQLDLRNFSHPDTLWL